LKTVEELKLISKERPHKGKTLYDIYKTEPPLEEVQPSPASPSPSIAAPQKVSSRAKTTAPAAEKPKPSSAGGGVLGSNPSKNVGGDQLAQIRAEKAKQFANQKTPAAKKPASPSSGASSPVTAKPKAVLDKEKEFREMTEEEALEAALAEKCGGSLISIRGILFNDCLFRDKCHFPKCDHSTAITSYLCGMCKFKCCPRHRFSLFIQLPRL